MDQALTLRFKSKINRVHIMSSQSYNNTPPNAKIAFSNTVPHFQRINFAHSALQILRPHKFLHPFPPFLHNEGENTPISVHLKPMQLWAAHCKQYSLVYRLKSYSRHLQTGHALSMVKGNPRLLIITFQELGIVVVWACILRLFQE